MATRDNIPMILAARTGAAAAQLALGARYFFGKSGLPQSAGTAFYWLERAARQGLEDAFLMIGKHVPYDMLSTMSRPYEAAPWYEKAYDAGVPRAGVTFSRLVLDHPTQFTSSVQHKAMVALRSLAQQDDHEAQWLLAQYLRSPEHIDEAETGLVEQELLRKAASAGIEAAQYALLERAWESSDHHTYLSNAMPLADSLLARHRSSLNLVRNAPEQAAAIQLSEQEITLLLRLAQHVQVHEGGATASTQRLLELAAAAGSVNARYQLGLLHACIDDNGRRTFPLYGAANYKKAVIWLLLAANSDCAAAWHGLSHIYARSEFSRRDLPTSRRYLQRAAEMGRATAQFDHACAIWRGRRETPHGDIRALYWWLQAARQGNAESAAALKPFAPKRNKGSWAHELLEQVTNRIRKAQPFLCARLELASAFGLTRPEALLLNLANANHGHCLEVDISACHARSKRRLILVEDSDQRDLLNQASRLFNDVDCGYEGPEGNYRQRQYRLATLLAPSTLP